MTKILWMYWSYRDSLITKPCSINHLAFDTDQQRKSVIRYCKMYWASWKNRCNQRTRKSTSTDTKTKPRTKRKDWRNPHRTLLLPLPLPPPPLPRWLPLIIISVPRPLRRHLNPLIVNRSARERNHLRVIIIIIEALILIFGGRLTENRIRLVHKRKTSPERRVSCTKCSKRRLAIFKR